MSLKNFEVISSKTIAKYCTHVFAENVVVDNKVITKIDRSILERITPGDVIFSKTDYLPDLFREISRHTAEVKIVTHESDYAIDDNVARAIPKNVTRMFSVNVATSSERVTAIPLGIANDYCKITLKPKEFRSFSDINNCKAVICCNINNNIAEREPLYNTEWDDEVIVSRIMSLESYSLLLENSTFVFCPEGNGLDTHRAWEALYMGKIPIVKKKIWNLNFRDLPVMYVNDFVDATKNERQKFLDRFSQDKFNLEKMSATFWGRLIND